MICRLVKSLIVFMLVFLSIADGTFAVGFARATTDQIPDTDRLIECIAIVNSRKAFIETGNRTGTARFTEREMDGNEALMSALMTAFNAVLNASSANDRQELRSDLSMQGTLIAMNTSRMIKRDGMLATGALLASEVAHCGRDFIHSDSK